jgi:transcriptional regulator with XRE-family HTH domain
MAYVEGLKARREKAGLSQNQLARLAVVDRQTVSRCENGYNVRPEKANLIRNAINRLEIYKSDPMPESSIKDDGKIGEFPKKNK